MGGGGDRAGRIVVLGAGPTGLGAAHRLGELGHPDWDVYEATGHVGGLAASVEDEHGFVWDHGGHVLFSHYEHVDRLVAAALGDDRESHVRNAAVWLHGRLVPYPLQHNIHRLPEPVFRECRDGIVAAQGADLPRRNFDEWIGATFGDGLARHFLRPYNAKVWAHPIETMGVSWQGERVPDVDVERIDANQRADRDDAGWGPNATFTFPARGTGLLHERIAGMLERPVHHGHRAVGIDPDRREVTFAGGATTVYDHLVTTLPIPVLLDAVAGCPADVRAAGARLRHTAGLFVGVGVRGEVPPERCWVYYPEPELPFYRVTYLSNYAAAMAPAGHFSLLAEISTSPHRPCDPDTAVARTVEGMERCGLLRPDQAADDVVTTQLLSVPYSYPVPTLDRDDALAVVHGWCEPRGIHPRGRFGAWRYEIGNTDHSLMMGVELVDHLLLGTAEATWTPPRPSG